MDTIKSSAEISLIFERGKRIGTADITLIVLRNEKQHGHYGRAAFVASKRLGNAVWRNRAKRRMRAVYKDTKTLFSSYDVVFLARRTINKASYSKLLNNVRHAMERNG